MSLQNSPDRPISVHDLEEFCCDVLRRVGVSETDARATADVLVTTDTCGVFTHGTKNLRGYVRRLQAGGLRARAKPRIVAEGPAWAMIDGDSGLGMVTSTFAMRVAMEKAKLTGVGYVGVRNSCHFGAAGFYAALAARENLIGIAVANDIPSVTAPGARGPVLGSNPLAFAVPTGDDRPILMDMATSTVAGGKVFAAAALNQKIPAGWVVDAAGKPTTDPSLFPHTATLTPMAGHKGYGLALLIETLSAIVTGAAMTHQVLSWSFDDPARATNHGAAFIAIDVGAMMSLKEFHARVAHLVREIRSTPRAQDCERVFIPGEMEWERRAQALVSGIELPPDVLASLRGLSELGFKSLLFGA
ncbi:MAG: Ldh family oxidoreductase [Verrucomicrobia bacterium]|nr:Ldh family oxidoreductase [Verrucomicrobiota bacterium]